MRLPGGRMSRQFVGILLARGAGSALQAIALVLLARAVSPVVFGAVGIVVGFVGIVLVATGLGMSLVVPWARARGEDGAVVAALRVNTWSNIGSALALVVGVGIWARHGELPVGVAAIGLSLALERNVDTWLGVPVADGNTSVSVVSLLLRRLVTLAVMVPALATGVDPVLSYTGGLVLGAVVAQVHVRRVVVIDRAARQVSAGEVVRQGLPFLVSNLTGQARTVDVPVVGAVLDATAAGVYSAAAKLVQPFLLVPQTLGAVLMPGSVTLSGGAARRVAGKLTVVFLTCLLPALPVVLRGEQVVTFVMGEPYAGAGRVLGWTVVGLPFIALSSSLGAVLQGQGRQRLVAVNGAVFAALLVVGLVIGAGAGGVSGAAAAVTVSYVLRSAALAYPTWSLGRVSPG